MEFPVDFVNQINNTLLNRIITIMLLQLFKQVIITQKKEAN